MVGYQIYVLGNGLGLIHHPFNLIYVTLDKSPPLSFNSPLSNLYNEFAAIIYVHIQVKLFLGSL